jgi:hypothetical protein
MESKDAISLKDTVYVIGAGFSAGLGYPLTKGLLIDVWGRLQEDSREQLRRIIEFHHPGFAVDRKTTFPDIEQLLTEIEVNLELFDASRPAEGNFKKAHLENAKEELLSEVGRWFHELYEEAHNTPWLSSFVRRLRRENAAIVSFNWDLVVSDSHNPAKEIEEGWQTLSELRLEGRFAILEHGTSASAPPAGRPQLPLVSRGEWDR